MDSKANFAICKVSNLVIFLSFFFCQKWQNFPKSLVLGPVCSTSTSMSAHMCPYHMLCTTISIIRHSSGLIKATHVLPHFPKLENKM